MDFGFFSVIKDVFGSELLIFLGGLLALAIILFWVRASKEFLVGILFLAFAGVTTSGIVPRWIFGILLILMGVFVASIIHKTFIKAGQ